MENLSRIIDVLSDGSVLIRTPSNGYQRLDSNLKVPMEGKFVQLRHWNSFPGMGDNDDAYPEMFNPSLGLDLRDPQGRRYEYMELPDAWMYFQFEFWKWNSQYKLPDGKVEGSYTRPGNARTFYTSTPGSVMYIYIDTGEAHRCFTDAGSREAGARDPVAGVNLSNRRNVEWLADPTCGAMLKVLRVVGQYYEIETLDILKPPPSLSYVISRPWLYFWCTQWDKFRGSTRFPQLTNANKVHGYPESGLASLLMSKGGKFRVLKSSCIPMTNEASWSPYSPA